MYDSLNYSLTITVKSKRKRTRIAGGSMLLRNLAEQVDALLRGWYNAHPTIQIPCSHCLQLDRKELTYIFTLDEVMNAVREGKTEIPCYFKATDENKGEDKTPDAIVNIADVAPDLTFSDVKHLIVDFKLLEMGEKFAEGGYAALFKAKFHGEQVAVKLLHDTGNDLESFQELQHETFVMGQLKHENIVELKGICTQPLCMIMDFFPLGSLDAFLKDDKPKFTWKYRSKVGTDVAKGMAYLHSNDFVHRDLRSPNILVASKSPFAKISVKVADFGTSVQVASAIAGGDFNECWAAPEILKRNTYNNSVDVYSFGVMLWELLQLGFPFAEYTEFQTKPRFEFEEAVINGLRPGIPSSCPPEFKQLITRCWHGETEKRPTFETLVKDLGAMSLPETS